MPCPDNAFKIKQKRKSYVIKRRHKKKGPNKLKLKPTSFLNPISDNVKKANEIIDLLEPSMLEQWTTCLKNQNYQYCDIKCLPSSQIEEKLLNWAFELCKNNVKKMYEDAVGWNEEAKHSEMTDAAARYLFLNHANTFEPIAFSHFRFDMDYGEDVLYCYELHVIPEERGKGIGNYLLDILEFLARTFKMSKVILTVFKANEGAIRFYKKCKYVEDYTSPENKSYLILSKYIN